MTKKFCHQCGNNLTTDDDIFFKCSSCKQTIYENPKPCVDLALFNQNGELLIAKRLREPFKGKYDLPGGFVDKYDSFDTALLREAKEELGLDESQIINIKYIGSYNSEYPWVNEVLRVSPAVFMADLADGAKVKAMDDVEAVEWINGEDINKYEYSNSEVMKTINLAFEKRSKNA